MAGPPTKTPFTDQDRDYMVKYLAKYTTDTQGRSGNELWKRLEENAKGKWNWAQRHSWQSWRNHYVKDKKWFDRKAQRYRAKNPPSESPPPPTPTVNRVRFNSDDDRHLAEYLADYSTSKDGRLGLKLYQVLVEDEDSKWPWATRHTMHSWRKRYSNNREGFDRYAALRQRDHAPIAVHETSASARKAPRKRKARTEEDASIPELDEEHERGEEAEQESQQVKKEDCVEEQEAGGESDNPQNSKKRRKRTSDEHSRKPAKRRRAEPAEDEQRSAPVRVEDAVSQTGSDEEQPKARLRGKREAMGPLPPSDDYAGNIFDASESSDSETEDEEEEEARILPPIAVRQEEEEEEVVAETDEEDEEVDQLAPSVSPSQKRMDVDATIDNREPPKSRSPSPIDTPTRTPIRLIPATVSQDQLYPSLPSPFSRDEDADNFPVPGRFPVTSASDDARAASVFSEAVPLLHELLTSQEEQRPVMSVIDISQAPTPPASSSQADVSDDTNVHPVPSEARYVNAEAGPSHVDAPPRAAHARPTKAKTFKRKPTEDLFASVTSTPSKASSRDATPTKRPREPPRLADGPFNHVFTGAMGKQLNGVRPSGVTDDAPSDTGEVWPPRRGRHKGKEKEKAELRTDNRRPLAALAPEVKTESQDQGAALQQMRALPVSTHHPFSQPTQDVGASQSAYSQEQDSQSQHHPFSQPSQFVDADMQWAHPLQSRRQANESGTDRPFKLPKVHLQRLEQELRKSGHLLQEPNVRRASFATSTPIQRASQRPLDLDIPVPDASTAREALSEDLSKNSDLSRSVRFDASVFDVKGQSNDYGPSTPHSRRHTLSDSMTSELQDDRAHADHVRIRRSLPILPSAPHGVRSADDSFVGTVSPSSSFSRPLKRQSLSFVQQPKLRSASAKPEPPLQITEDDESVVVHIGVEVAVQTMSENHGFNPEIVRRVWSQTQSLRKTDTVLRRMREAAEKAALQFLDDVDEEGDQPRAGPSNAPAQGAAPRRSSHKLDSSPILRITPADPDEDSLEYSPPKPTRAGQYVRLVREGRQDEAIAREVSYASGASPMKTPQRDAAETNRGSVAAERPPASDGGTHSMTTWATGVPSQASSQDVSSDSGRNLKDHTAKIELGKKLGRMLANVGV